jgi:uncharacterized membrane protein
MGTREEILKKYWQKCLRLFKLILGTISGIILIIGVVMAVMSILPKSNDQLIADGKAKSGH